jgi:hypothetical protein
VAKPLVIATKICFSCLLIYIISAIMSDFAGHGQQLKNPAVTIKTPPERGKNKSMEAS